MVRKKMRKGVAMIELIFSIVIMAFVFAALPKIMTQVKHASTFGVKQESIALLATQVNLVMSNEWDDKNTRSNYSSFILNTNGNESLNKNETTSLRGARTIYKNTRLYSEIENVPASTDLIIEYDKNTSHIMDDVDDFNEREVKLMLEGDIESKDYLDKEIKIKTVVKYASYTGNFNAKEIVVVNNGTTETVTNIKSIEAKLTTDSEKYKDTKLILKSFASNIGAYNPEIKGGF